MKNLPRILLQFVIFILLTLLTQIGGGIYLLVILLTKNIKRQKLLLRFVSFSLVYLLFTYFIVPITAPLFGREKIKESEYLQAHSMFYRLSNRDYVSPELNNTLSNLANDFGSLNNGIKVIYLDANFPFIDKFPPLPHLSHNDGKKIDLSFIYKDLNGKLTNKKPSVSGYGVYEEPVRSEFNQAASCKSQGYWQYDFPKYLTLGTTNKKITFSDEETKRLIAFILAQKNTSKLFIEPHLKTRLNLTHPKIRFHGCRAVRHDDHIHFQLK